MGYWDMRAALEWQVAMGADEAILDQPVNRYDAPAKPAEKPKPSQQPVQAEMPKVDAAILAKQVASPAEDLDSLAAAMRAFEECELKRGARNFVFSDGLAGSRVMIIGEAPGRDEDIEGRPFVGRAGVLLDQMFAAIGLARTNPTPDTALYITNVLPWRPPQNRDPSPEEIAMMLPFLEKHVALAKPDFVVAMGNIACQAVLGRRGITRLRGQWSEAFDRPCLPMFHPAYLLRSPLAKREAWADLLSLKARLA